MISTDEARQLALDLPDAVEQDHHGRPSFRVTKRIFATLWDDRHMNVMLDEPGILTAVVEHPREWWLPAARGTAAGTAQPRQPAAPARRSRDS